jgi:hypothetical protein
MRGYVTVKRASDAQNCPLQLVFGYNKADNVRTKNFALRLFRETVAAVEMQ